MTDLAEVCDICETDTMVRDVRYISVEFCGISKSIRASGVWCHGNCGNYRLDLAALEEQSKALAELKKLTSNPKDKRILGVSVILRCRDEVLMGLRKGSHGAGTWAFPGGKVEPNESVMAAALRELAEETGVSLAHLSEWEPRQVAWTEDDFAHASFITLFVEIEVLTKLTVQNLEPNKCAGWEWVPICDLGHDSEGKPYLDEPLFLPVYNLLSKTRYFQDTLSNLGYSNADLP